MKALTVGEVEIKIQSFSPASRIILIESVDDLIEKYLPSYNCFSPASRIILIERTSTHCDLIVLALFQSRKQDYFN